MSDISIHSLRGEGDFFHLLSKSPKNISIHSLRGEGDMALPIDIDSEIGFQSTPSVGRETRRKYRFWQHDRYFNPLPPWGGRLSAFLWVIKYGSHFNPLPPWGGRLTLTFISKNVSRISIHSLRGEGDLLLFVCRFRDCISIHSLRGEGDSSSFFVYAAAKIISIHSLRGEGDIQQRTETASQSRFQSTPSVGRETRR